MEQPSQCTRMVTSQSALHRWMKENTLLRGTIINQNCAPRTIDMCCALLLTITHFCLL